MRATEIAQQRSAETVEEAGAPKRAIAVKGCQRWLTFTRNTGFFENVTFNLVICLLLMLRSDAGEATTASNS